ncbi:hypothetical protein V8F06_007194 [Rhypophila decipiens]
MISAHEEDVVKSEMELNTQSDLQELSLAASSKGQILNFDGEGCREHSISRENLTHRQGHSLAPVNWRKWIFANSLIVLLCLLDCRRGASSSNHHQHQPPTRNCRFSCSLLPATQNNKKVTKTPSQPQTLGHDLLPSVNKLCHFPCLVVPLATSNALQRHAPLQVFPAGTKTIHICCLTNHPALVPRVRWDRYNTNRLTGTIATNYTREPVFLTHTPLLSRCGKKQ